MGTRDSLAHRVHAGLGASPPRPPSSALHSLGAPAERREEGGPAATGRCGAGSEWGACRAGQMLCPLTAATPGGAWEDPPPRAPLLLRGRRCLRHGLRVTVQRACSPSPRGSGSCTPACSHVPKPAGIIQEGIRGQRASRADTGNVHLCVCGPCPWVLREAAFSIYQGQSDSAKPLQSTGSVSDPSTHCTSASWKKIAHKEHSKQNDKKKNNTSLVPVRLKSYNPAKHIR